MRLFRLACSNFRRSIKEYAALIVSLSFSVFIFFNFQNVVYSDSMNVLKDMKKSYIDMIVQAASVVFGVFLFFFIWYATNVFLNQRKKEIGIYTFMGLDNIKIGKLYALEALFISVFSVITGLLTGIVFSKLFQMLLLKLSDIQADIRFGISVKPILITAVLFLFFFGLMIVKGYRGIVRSSVLELLSGARQKEMRHETAALAAVKVCVGIAVLIAGYICAASTGRLSSLGYGVAAVVLVIIGTYLLFGGAIPYFIRGLTKNKRFLYQKDRNLWVNNLAFRIRQNYRTYAMVTILMICSVTVLGTAIALRQRYEKMIHFQETYTFQVLAQNDKVNEQQISDGIEQENQIRYKNHFAYLGLEASMFHTEFVNTVYGLVPYSQIKKAAMDAGLKFDYDKPSDDEAIQLTHIILMNLSDESEEEYVHIGEDTYKVTARDSTAYLGDLQNSMGAYIVNDSVYEKYKPLGQEMFLYNYKIENPDNAEASVSFVKGLREQQPDSIVGCNMIRPENAEDTWIKIMYSLCIFMFVTFLLASGSIIFIKLNNDAYEDRERYSILKKMGISEDSLGRAMKQEIRFTYYCPFVLMTVTSWFAIKALGNVMKEDLFMVNVYSASAILAVFTLIYLISVRVFKRKVLC